MKTKITYLFVAGALALAACFPSRLERHDNQGGVSRRDYAGLEDGSALGSG